MREHAEELLRYARDVMKRVANDAWTPDNTTFTQALALFRKNMEDDERPLNIRFNYTYWVDSNHKLTDCGTSACVLGHMAMTKAPMDILQHYSVYSASIEAYDIDDRLPDFSPSLRHLVNLLQELGPDVDGFKLMHLLFIPTGAPESVNPDSAASVAEWVDFVVTKVLDLPPEKRGMFIDGMAHFANFN